MLSDAQFIAIEMLTSGKGYSYKEVAERCGVIPKTLWKWRNQNTEFIDKLNEINKQRWEAAEDAARESAIRLCKQDNNQMVQFVLRNAGYNPTTKIDADVNTNIDITIEE